MAIVVKDRVKETTAVAGTGTATLLGAASGFQSFAAIGNGNITYYAIVNTEDGTWEVGKGTYSTTGPTLTRDTVYESSNAGALVNFAAGVKDIFCTYPAERAIYEEPNGNTLIDGGPLTVVGTGVTAYTSFSAVLAELYGNVDSFAQLYTQNLNDGSSASADLVAYNDLGDGLTNFVDVGINSSNYSSVDYPIFTPGSSYAFNDGGEMFVGSATDDLVLFAGGVDTTDEAVRIDKTTKNVTTVADVDVGGDVNATGGTFTAAVTTTASMAAPATTEFVTREYVDNATSNGFHVHQPVLVATTGNLTATYNQPGGAGVGVGATLTNSGTQAALEIDGVAMTVADRILVWQQTTGLQNGIYVVTTVGSGSTNWVLTRSADANTSSEGDPGTLGGGDYFFVESGDTLGYHSYICVNTTAITFGTTSIDFNEFSSVPQYTGGTNITVDGSVISLSGTVAATNGGTGVNTVTTGDLLYGSGTNTWGKLAAGAAYKSLVMNAGGTNVEWNAVALNQSGAVSGALGPTNGGTGQSSYTLGDLLYSDASNSLAKLAGNTTTTKKFLTQTGGGAVSDAPAWGTISGSDVNGAVSSATNVAGGAANKVVYQTGPGATGFVDAPTSSGTALTWNGSAFTWSAAGGATITNDTTTNANYYPVWANATSGTMADAFVSSTKMTFNPSTGTFNATQLQSGGNNVLTTANSPIPSGTVMLFVQTAAPTGWTKSTAHDNKALRIVSGTVGSGGTVAFTTAFASKTPAGTVSTSTGNTTAAGSISVTVSAGTLSTGNTTQGGSVSTSTSVSLASGGSVSYYTLSTSEMPSHYHTLQGYYNNTVSDQNQMGIFTFNNGIPRTSNGGTYANYTGGSGSHNHGFTNPSYSASSSSSFSGSAHNHTVTGSPSVTGQSFTGTAHNHTATSSFTGTAIDLAVQYVDAIIATKD